MAWQHMPTGGPASADRADPMKMPIYSPRTDHIQTNEKMLVPPSSEAPIPLASEIERTDFPHAYHTLEEAEPPIPVQAEREALSSDLSGLEAISSPQIQRRPTTFNIKPPWSSLHIKSDSLFNNDLVVTTTSKKTSAEYTVRSIPNTSVAQPPILYVYRCARKKQAETTPVGIVTFNADQTIDLRFHNADPVPMVPQHNEKPHNMVLQQDTLTYLSPAPGVGTLVWSYASLDCALLRTTIDNGGASLARFVTREGKSIEKGGTLFFAGGGLGPKWTDEVMTTALAFDAYNAWKNNSHAKTKRLRRQSFANWL